MELTRLLAPGSVAVVGASTRPGSYGNQAVANLVASGFPGPVWGVHPTAREVHGVACVPRLADLPAAPDAVVIATPAATVPGLLAEAGERGCGGAVVFAAGFAEIAGGRVIQDELVAVARAYDLPVCGPNGNGIVSVTGRAPLWGDACAPRRPGPVAIVSQSGNIAVNALLSMRGLRLHTIVSCGNQAVIDAADYVLALTGLDGVGSVALYLEDEGDGARLADALAACAERGIGVAVLKAGVSERGASAAAAHTGAVAGDARVLRALIEESGGAWARNPHELLELAKTLASARPRRRHMTGRGVLIVTCSGGDAAVGADEAARLGVPLPPLAGATAEKLTDVLPPTATPGNPLDYTAVVFGQTERTADLITVAARDTAVGPVLVYYDRPRRMSADAAESWDGALDGIIMAARRLDQQVIVASTLPDLMPEETAERLADDDIVPVAGLTEAVLCAGALVGPPGDAARLREIAIAARLVPRDGSGGPRGLDGPGGWLAEHEAKELLGGHGVAVPVGRVAHTAEEAVAVARELGGKVALKLSAPDLRHKTDSGALILGVRGDDAVRDGFERLRALPGRAGTGVLVEEMLAPGVELMIAVRRDGLVPVLVLALGGTWVEILDDAVLVPLPCTPDRVARAVRTLRGAPLLTGARGGPPLALDRLCALAARVGDLALAEDLELVELNPVIAHADRVTAADAVIRCRHPVGAPLRAGLQPSR